MRLLGEETALGNILNGLQFVCNLCDYLCTLRFCRPANAEAVCVCVTCASSSSDGDQMGPVLCDGLYWELVLAERGLLHDGDCCQRSSLRALDDPADST